MSHQRDNLQACFHPVVWSWFQSAFDAPTEAQRGAWPAIASGASTLLLAPTGSGKTLAAFLIALDRLMFPEVDRHPLAGDASGPANAGLSSPSAVTGVRTLYISPLKALGVDVQRNLRAPLAGVRATADRHGRSFQEPRIGVRSGDTPNVERQRINRDPPDILITTPESLFLLLTSRARRILTTVETVIVDEIHSLVGTKRGVHLFTSLERLEHLRAGPDRISVQRIGLSATQRPLDEVARLLGGAAWPNDKQPAASAAAPIPRPVTVVEAGRSRQMDLRIEVPVEDLSHLASSGGASSNTTGAKTAESHLEADRAAADDGLPVASIWSAIHPRLVELIEQHRATMVFVNSRRLAERLASSLNDTAGKELALAHHGSIAKETRQQIEDRLKRGDLPAIIATSSLELGIDMGAVDLVIQIEAPQSIASGIQRIGRASHQVGGTSHGVVFPKFRGDLLACSAAAKRMLAGEVEQTFYPRNPLDVLAQQIVAMVSEGPMDVEAVFRLLRCAAPFVDLPRSSFESVLDMLSGRYPSTEFSELRPRLNWDRINHMLSPRNSTQRLAVVNAGTIPDRGLYGVFLAGENGASSSRVGELDEEMVFETRPGDIFLLGASSWRVTEISNDRVLVVPAPGEPGKMPFWRGDGPGRPYEFGVAIGRLSRELLRLERASAIVRLSDHHCLDDRAARNLVDYLHDQVAATGEAPSDRTIVVETFVDEIGDWRIAILSPFGARVHAPWATAIVKRLRDQTGDDVEMLWSDDGIIFRLPEAHELPPWDILFPDAEQVESLVIDELGATPLFAGHFRENAARALLLPRRQPGKRTPLWLQRRKSADLLSVASRYPSFPIILETYRECLRDVFDLPSLKSMLRSVKQQVIRVHSVRTEAASPFASSLMFDYTANFIYNGDTPLAERRAQTLALDHAQLSELLGAAEMRELLTAESVDEIAMELQRLDTRLGVRDADECHDLLRLLGDLSRQELAARTQSQFVGQLDQWLEGLLSARRIIAVRISGDDRYVAVEDAGTYRDALGVVPPPGVPAAFLEPAEAPLLDLIARLARTHVPFQMDHVARRFGLAPETVRVALETLVQQGRLLKGEFLPGRRGQEWCDPEVLRRLKRRSLAQWRKQIEPVTQPALARFLLQWQGVTQPRRGLDGLLDVVEQLQGMPLPASDLENEILPCRVAGFQPSDLDELCAAGEVIWRGCESLGADDGKIALFLTDHYPHLAMNPEAIDEDLAQSIHQLLQQNGALFFDQIADQLGGFRHDLLHALWQLVWAGHVTNDTLVPLRSRRKSSRHAASGLSRFGRRRSGNARFRSRRTVLLQGAEGRWSLLTDPSRTLPDSQPVSATERCLALASQLTHRYGVLTREMVTAERVAGGFAGIYPVLKSMEEAGRLRRGYFVEGLGAAQFAASGADDLLRQRRTTPDNDLSSGAAEADASNETVALAACDPANPYGAALAWPATTSDHGGRPQRTAGARVVIDNGRLLAYLGRTGQSMMTFLPDDPAAAEKAAERLVEFLARQAEQMPVLISKIDGCVAQDAALRPVFQRFGFSLTSRGLHHR